LNGRFLARLRVPGAGRPARFRTAFFTGFVLLFTFNLPVTGAETDGRSTPTGAGADASAGRELSFEPFRWSAGIKGVQSIVDVEDAVKLGIKHAAHNVLLSQIVDISGGSPEAVWKVDDENVPIRLDVVRQLDVTFRRLTAAGVNNTIILLNSVPNGPDPKNPLIHPRTDLKHAPNHLGAFNTTSKPGERGFRAALEFLANRYSNPTGEHGWVSGYIIGNEVQAHWYWYNLGEATPADVIADYAHTLRVAHQSVRKFHPEVRIYVSMDHHWTASPDGNPKKALPGKVLLDDLNARIKADGDFEWHVAFHPYPEDLFNPRTWNDKQATLDASTPKITFKNLEVLSQYLRRAGMQFENHPRRIILSEQGFHTPDGPDGERIQAAAFAYAYYRALHIDGIDAFILHRHVDHRDEGGLKLGIWTCKPGSATTPDRKKYLYYVFRAADTENWRQTFEFARPIIGIDRWEELLPASAK
jgi:hypothetical protein